MTERLSNKNPCRRCRRRGGDCDGCIEYAMYVDELEEKLAKYETAEEESRLLTLPCKPGNVAYVIIPSYITCSKYGHVFDEYSCIRCEEYEKECDSYLEYCIWENKYTTLRWIIGSLERFGKTVFINREEAEKTLEEMNKDIGTN